MEHGRLQVLMNNPRVSKWIRIIFEKGKLFKHEPGEIKPF